MGLEDNPYAAQTQANTDAPWVGEGTPVDVDLDGLREYAKHMADQQRDLMSRSMHLNHLLEMPFQAWDGAVLGEAAFVRSQLMANAKELSMYLGSLGQTLMNIGSAAQTVADCYQSADGTSAASLSAVLFAFGDKSQPRPGGLPSHIGQTYIEAMYANANTTATPADSPLWGRSTEKTLSPYQTVLTATAPNGQTRETVTTSVPGSGHTIVTTTVYGADGKVLSTSSTRTSTSYNTTTNTQVKTVESAQNGTPTGRSTTTTTYDGTRVAREETVSYTPDGNGGERPTSTRTEAVDGDGVRTETTSRTDQNGRTEVTDRVVVGPETPGQSSPRDRVANDYDPYLNGNG